MNMKALEDIESMRLEIQNWLDSLKTQYERNKLGQFATPTMLAVDILRYAKSRMSSRARIYFLDPAFGTGAFYSALLRVFPVSQIASAIGFEIDPRYVEQSRKIWYNTPLKLKEVDFTRTVPPVLKENRINLLICNPPYVRHHHLSNSEKKRLQQLAYEASNIKLNGLTGLYCYYICLAHRWMAKNCLAGWLIPSEFMDVNYGHQLKKYLLESVTLLHIHHFRPEDLQFKDADVSSAVVWFKNNPPPSEHFVRFTYGSSLRKPEISKLISTRMLRTVPKWTRIQSSSGILFVRNQVRLSDLFEIKRGLATGGNDFFILKPEMIARYHIPKQFLKPILPNPRYLFHDEIGTDRNGNPTITQKFFLLSCNLPENTVKKKYPLLWKYLQLVRAKGIHKRYLCRHRSPWYSQENRLPALFLCSYMGRQGTNSHRPFRFILNYSKATAANAYLLLYPKKKLAQMLEDNLCSKRAIWEALKEIPQDTLIHSGRVYGGGLHKIEPRELGSVPADIILKKLGIVSPSNNPSQN
jgi:predicted RNA methylase